MSVIQDGDYVLYKAIAKFIKTGLDRPMNKLNAVASAQFAKYEKEKDLFMNSDDYENLGLTSKRLKKIQQELIATLAIQDALERMVCRNDQRIGFISERLTQMGIYNEQVDKKAITGAIDTVSKNVDSKALNLNSKENNGITLKYFAGEILAFRDNELDFDLDENRDVLLNSSQEFFHEVVFTFPYSVGTIPEEYILVPNLKNKIIKESILYVASKIKSQTIAESNKELGGQLENGLSILNIQQYAKELKNYYNVVVKQCIKKQEPEFAEDADLILKCNETSEFLPITKKVEMPVNGFVSDVEKTDTEESEEVRIGQEEESHSNISREELLNLLLSDDDFDFGDENKEDSQEKNIAEENRQTEEEKKEQEEDDIDKLLKEMESLLKEDETEE